MAVRGLGFGSDGAHRAALMPVLAEATSRRGPTRS